MMQRIQRALLDLHNDATDQLDEVRDGEHFSGAAVVRNTPDLSLLVVDRNGLIDAGVPLDRVDDVMALAGRVSSRALDLMVAAIAEARAEA